MQWKFKSESAATFTINSNTTWCSDNSSVDLLQIQIYQFTTDPV
jgi:hypothetical protein